MTTFPPPRPIPSPLAVAQPARASISSNVGYEIMHVKTFWSNDTDKLAKMIEEWLKGESVKGTKVIGIAQCSYIDPETYLAGVLVTLLYS